MSRNLQNNFITGTIMNHLTNDQAVVYSVILTIYKGIAFKAS